MIIRKASIDDAKRIHDINTHALGNDYSLEKTRQQLIKIIPSLHAKIFVACIDEIVVGYIHIAAYECSYMDSFKDILSLAIDKKYQKKGIGKGLLEKAEQWAKEQGSVGIRLVSGMNRVVAHQFYQRCGYINRKDQKNFVKYL